MPRVLAVIDTPQHLVPGDKASLANIIRELFGSNSSRVDYNFTEIMQAYSLANQSSHSTGRDIIGLLLVGALIAAGFILLYWLSLRSRSGVVRVHGSSPGMSSAWDAEAFYVYSGGKHELRRLYKRLLQRLHSLGVYVPRGYTVSEVADKAKRVLGSSIELFAQIYNHYMYSRGEPPSRVVEEARSLVESKSG